jgi:lysylphosphatidylglycerol synthetase-like protein (DUF2156 family)
LWLVTFTTLGRGILKLYSVIGPALPERKAILEKIFPLEFLHLSRFITVLIGFALVISPINIYKHKTRAWWSVMLLAVAAILRIAATQESNSLDYETFLSDHLYSCAVGNVTNFALLSGGLDKGEARWKSCVIR